MNPCSPTAIKFAFTPVSQGCVFLIAALASSLLAEELPLDYPQAGGRKDLSVPAGASATLVLPERAMIGEQIPAKLVIRNTGTQPFEITTGGDYRATGFPQRMKVRVRSADGTTLPELTHANYGMGGGGLMGGSKIEPGVTHAIEFPLDRYVSFSRAGTYTVTAGHDLGWRRAPSKPHPLGSASIEVKEPTLEQAQTLVNSIIIGRQATPTHVVFQGTSYPAVREEQADYVTQAKLCVLRHYVYLQPLREAADKGSIESVSGIGHIATAEAAESLIALLRHASPGVQSEALTQLCRRIPSKVDPAKPAHSGWGDTFQIDPLLPVSWKPEFEPKLVAGATSLLSHPDPNVVSAAAGIVEACGSSDSAPALVEALQKSLDTYRRIKREETAAMYPPLPEHALLAALDALRKRGWRAQPPGRTAAMVVWFRQLADDSIAKPQNDDWKDDMITWVTSKPPTLQENALRVIPLPLSEAAKKAVLEALEEDDPRVLAAACEVAQKSKLPEFVGPLVQLVEVERVGRVHSAAIEAAKACGARMELWRAVANCIVVKELLVDSIHALVSGTIELPRKGGSGGSSNFSREQRFQIRDEWLHFLNQNEKAILAGKKTPQPDEHTAAKLTRANLVSGNSVVDYELKDGSRWPPEPEKK